MKLNYFKDTDTLYIELNENNSVQTKQLDDNTIIEIDQELNIIEAEMDAQELNNIAENEYDENIDSENLDQVNDLNKSEEPNKDDEIS